ncbi:MAG: hypothetical protein WCA39_00745, partial [Nitrososphaeraceae archaeon]
MSNWRAPFIIYDVYAISPYVTYQEIQDGNDDWLLKNETNLARTTQWVRNDQIKNITGSSIGD